MGPALAGTNTFANSMVGDVCEADARRTGVKLAAVYGAVLTWLRKTGLALALLVAGLVLNWSGFDVTLPGPQSEDTLLTMRLLFSFFPLLTFGASLLILQMYRLPDSEGEPTAA